MTTLAFVKSTTWSGPTAPALSGQSFGPGPDDPGNVVRISTSSPDAGADTSSNASSAIFDSVVTTASLPRIWRHALTGSCGSSAISPLPDQRAHEPEGSQKSCLSPDQY